MRQSRLFGKTVREAPKDEVSENAKLLERGAFVAKSMAGVYEYLPLGFRVLEKINAIIREEINAIGGQEMFLSALQPKERWEKSGRWSVLNDIMYQFKDHSGREVGLASTHEEAMTELALRAIHSYRDLPLFVYQIQTKFRDEPRAKSGVIRGREFLMKDLYSFHRDEKDLDEFYAKADRAYQRIFSRCGLHAYVTQASGGTFTKQFTHEYQVLTDAGEDWILYGAECGFSQNKEISSLKEGDKCSSCGDEALILGKSVEVGNIFKLGTKFSEQFGLHYLDENGAEKPVVMGSYGIGPGRLMGTIAEVHHDERGMVWPESVAPFALHLIELKSEQADVKKTAEKLYERLLAKGIEVLYDDRDDKSPGEKFADADLLGMPWRAVISEKTISKDKIELKERVAAKGMLLSKNEFLKKIAKGGKRGRK